MNEHPGAADKAKAAAKAPAKTRTPAQGEIDKGKTGGDVARDVAGGKKDEITDRTGRYR